MTRRRLKLNVAKTQVIVNGEKAEVVTSVRYPCAVCGKGVGHNSVLKTICGLWCRNQCSGVRNIVNAQDFQCPTFKGQNQIEELHDNRQLDGSLVEEVKEFCYLSDRLDFEGGK